MEARVVSVRIETPWEARRPLVSCVARLSRRLTRPETRAIARFPEFRAVADTVEWSCRPEESEAFEKRLGSVLRLAGRLVGSARRLRGLPRVLGLRGRPVADA